MAAAHHHSFTTISLGCLFSAALAAPAMAVPEATTATFSMRQTGVIERLPGQLRTVYTSLPDSLRPVLDRSLAQATRCAGPGTAMFRPDAIIPLGELATNQTWGLGVGRPHNVYAPQPTTTADPGWDAVALFYYGLDW